MTIREYENRIKDIIADATIVDIHTSPDFQCDQTDGFPSSLCVHWEKGKAWSTLNAHMIEDGTDITPYLQGCADYGIRNCADAEDFNTLLRQLGEDAYENACLPEEETEESIGMQF